MKVRCKTAARENPREEAHVRRGLTEPESMGVNGVPGPIRRASRQEISEQNWIPRGLQNRGTYQSSSLFE